MPKFVSGSSGHIYSHDKLAQEEDEILAVISGSSGTTTTTTTTTNNNVNTSTTSIGDRKPSAVNKKGTREKQKSSLDLFKEELRRLNEERDEQRNKVKNSLNSSSSNNNNNNNLEPTTSRTSSICLEKQTVKPPPPLVPVPLKPDPRCPTTLTLQVNLNPNSRDKESSSSGSFDTGDPTTTNLYLGNLNPIVTENDLCDIFGKFGPLASIKIMWPRTEEERARNRNSGFVAYMSRVDAERALKSLNGMEYKNYELKLVSADTSNNRQVKATTRLLSFHGMGENEMKWWRRPSGCLCNKWPTSYKPHRTYKLISPQIGLGWGKAVPLPKNPVFIPRELIEFMARPWAQSSGLPFNSQLHPSDLARGYTVPKPWPRPVDVQQQQQQQQQQPQVSSDSIRSQQDTYQEFMEVLQRSTVHVLVPQDSALLELIHHTIDCALREGPIYEAMLIARESENPTYKFLHDTTCLEHIYYRWKLYSVLHGEDVNVWRTEAFRMFEGGPMWQPPPLNPYADGMPLELVEQLTGISKQMLTSEGVLSGSGRKLQISSEPPTKTSSDSTRSGCLKFKGKFGPELVAKLREMLANLTPTRSSVGAAMLFCIQHSDAADEIIDCFEQIQSGTNSPPLAYKVRLAQLFLISDILHNSSAAVTNASFYRKGFQAKLVGVFGRLHNYMQTIEDRHRAERFKQKVLSVLNAWGYFHMYESKFLLQLSNIFLGITTSDIEQQHHHQQQHEEASESVRVDVSGQQVTISGNKVSPVDAELDGNSVDEEVLAQCLEERGLSLRWYKTLDLSDDELEETTTTTTSEEAKQRSRSPATPTPQRDEQATRFKASKWELISEDQERKSPPARLISQPITTRAVPVKDLSSQKVGSPDYNDHSSPGGSSSNESN